MTAPKPNLFLVTGIPGTGKTTFGDALVRDFGFVHYDLEDTTMVERLIADPATFIEGLLQAGKDTVATWGFNPEHQPSVSAVLQFRDNGFKLIWFDGNRQAALHAFRERAKSKSSSDAEFYWRMQEFHLQMYRIEATNVIDTIKPVIVDPFDVQAQFKPIDRLLQELRRQ